MQMYPLHTPHIVFMPGIDKKVGISTRFDTSLDKRESVLRHTYIIHIIVYHQQTPFEIPCQSTQVGLFISFGILLRSIHIALSVHYLIISPVNHRPPRYTHLKKFRITKQKGCRHMSSEAPSVYTDPVAIHIGKRSKELTPSTWSFPSSIPNLRKVTFSNSSPRLLLPWLSRLNTRYPF